MVGSQLTLAGGRRVSITCISGHGTERQHRPAVEPQYSITLHEVPTSNSTEESSRQRNRTTWVSETIVPSVEVVIAGNSSTRRVSAHSDTGVAQTQHVEGVLSKL